VKYWTDTEFGITQLSSNVRKFSSQLFHF